VVVKAQQDLRNPPKVMTNSEKTGYQSEDAKCADHCWLRVKFRILKCPSSRFYGQVEWT